MKNYPFAFVNNCIVLLFLALACAAVAAGDPTDLPLAVVVFWLALSGLLGTLSDKAEQVKNYRLLRLFTWGTLLVSSVIPATLGGFVVDGLQGGAAGGGLILLANLAIYLHMTGLLKANKK